MNIKHCLYFYVSLCIWAIEIYILLLREEVAGEWCYYSVAFDTS